MLRSALDADAYWETHVRAKKRKELRLLQKRLAELGTVESRLLVDGAALAACRREYLALAAACWTGAVGSALPCDDWEGAFLRAAVAHVPVFGTVCGMGRVG